VPVGKDGTVGVEYWSGKARVGRSTAAAPAGVELLLPGAKAVPVVFRLKSERAGVLELGPVKVGTLTLTWRITRKNPSLVERTLFVKADADQRFSVVFPLDVEQGGEFASFSGPEKFRVVYDTGVRERRNQTFPVALMRTGGRVLGLSADSPGLWENRCQVLIDPAARRLAVLTGDGGKAFKMVIKPPEDARDTYQYDMDGWQKLAAGETRRYTTWVFASPARNHYDAQVAFHLAVANARGWNESSLQAILRNSAYYLLRRNLMRDGKNRPRDGKYIFISGMTYGWKQWVSTGFSAAFGRKVLTDDQVLTHYRTSEKVKTRYGLRVISAADGSLLPGHNGAYCHGGSWFFCDAGNYLLAGVHGLAANEVDARLTERIKLELTRSPAFNEDINTVTGTPHGNAPYADYSGYLWLRSEIRRRLGQKVPDPVGSAIDAHLKVVRDKGVLRLEPSLATDSKR